MSLALPAEVGGDSAWARSPDLDLSHRHCFAIDEWKRLLDPRRLK